MAQVESRCSRRRAQAHDRCGLFGLPPATTDLPLPEFIKAKSQSTKAKAWSPVGGPRQRLRARPHLADWTTSRPCIHLREPPAKGWNDAHRNIQATTFAYLHGRGTNDAGSVTLSAHADVPCHRHAGGNERAAVQGLHRVIMSRWDRDVAGCSSRRAR